MIQPTSSASLPVPPVIDLVKVAEVYQQLPEVRAAASCLERVEAFRIVDDETLEEAANMTRMIATAIGGIEKSYKKPKGEAFKYHRDICGEERRHLQPYQQADKLLRQGMLDYHAERKRRVAAAAKELENAAIRDALTRGEGVDFDQQDNVDAHAELLVPALPTPPATAEPNGVRFSERAVWTVDLPALVAAVAAGQAPIDALTVNEIWMGEQVRARGTALALPGVAVTLESYTVVTKA